MLRQWFNNIIQAAGLLQCRRLCDSRVGARTSVAFACGHCCRDQIDRRASRSYRGLVLSERKKKETWETNTRLRNVDCAGYIAIFVSWVARRVMQASAKQYGRTPYAHKNIACIVDCKAAFGTFYVPNRTGQVLFNNCLLTCTIVMCVWMWVCPALGCSAEWNRNAANGCIYKHVNEPMSWFKAIRHCHSAEQASELVTPGDEAEAKFVSELGSRASAWVYGFHDNDSWNIDANLWHAQQPGNFNDAVEFCAMQTDTTHLLSTASCSAQLPFVCKKCPSIPTVHFLANAENVAPASPRAVHRARRAETTTTTTTAARGSSTTTTTGAHVSSTTTTSTSAPEFATDVPEESEPTAAPEPPQQEVRVVTGGSGDVQVDSAAASVGLASGVIAAIGKAFGLIFGSMICIRLP